MVADPLRGPLAGVQMQQFARPSIGAYCVTFDTIDGICPDCGLTRMDLLGSGLWDGWSGPEDLPASGRCYTGRCQRCGAILETLLVGDEEPDSVKWAAVDDEHRERIEWMLSGREGWPPE